MDHLLIESTAFILSMAMLCQSPTVCYWVGLVLNPITYGGAPKKKQTLGGWSGAAETSSLSSSGSHLSFLVSGGPESSRGVHTPASTTSTGLNPY